MGDSVRPFRELLIRGLQFCAGRSQAPARAGTPPGTSTARARRCFFRYASQPSSSKRSNVVDRPYVFQAEPGQFAGQPTAAQIARGLPEPVLAQSRRAVANRRSASGQTHLVHRRCGGCCQRSGTGGAVPSRPAARPQAAQEDRDGKENLVTPRSRGGPVERHAVQGGSCEGGMPYSSATRLTASSTANHSVLSLVAPPAAEEAIFGSAGEAVRRGELAVWRWVVHFAGCFTPAERLQRRLRAACRARDRARVRCGDEAGAACAGAAECRTGLRCRRSSGRKTRLARLAAALPT